MPNPGQIAATATYRSQFRALFTPGVDSWFDADNVNVSSGNTVSWIDVMDSTHLLQQASSSSQADAPAADASFGGSKTVLFNGTLDEYTSNRPASSWAFLHGASGSASTVVSVYYLPTTPGNQVIWSTFSSSGTGSAWHYASLGYLGVVQSNNSTIEANAGAGAFNTPTFSRCCFDILDSFDLRVFQKGTLVSTANLSTSVYNTSPNQTLRVGNLFNGASNRFPGRLRAIYFFRRALTAPEVSILHSYIQQTTGISP